MHIRRTCKKCGTRRQVLPVMMVSVDDKIVLHGRLRDRRLYMTRVVSTLCKRCFEASVEDFNRKKQEFDQLPARGLSHEEANVIMIESFEQSMIEV